MNNLASNPSQVSVCVGGGGGGVVDIGQKMITNEIVGVIR